MVKLIIAALIVIGNDIRKIFFKIALCPVLYLCILIFEVAKRYINPTSEPKETPKMVIAEIISRDIFALAERQASIKPTASLPTPSIICETAISRSFISALKYPLTTLASEIKIIDGATAIIVALA